jgi:hypothetical protein
MSNKGTSIVVGDAQKAPLPASLVPFGEVAGRTLLTLSGDHDLPPTLLAKVVRENGLAVEDVALGLRVSNTLEMSDLSEPTVAGLARLCRQVGTPFRQEIGAGLSQADLHVHLMKPMSDINEDLEAMLDSALKGEDVAMPTSRDEPIPFEAVNTLQETVLQELIGAARSAGQCDDEEAVNLIEDLTRREYGNDVLRLFRAYEDEEDEVLAKIRDLRRSEIKDEDENEGLGSEEEEDDDMEQVSLADLQAADEGDEEED